jgi:co-chaperonin GroES (HSP10)
MILLGNRILVERKVNPNPSKIQTADQASLYVKGEGKVLQVGEGTLVSSGEYLKPLPKSGDEIMYNDRAPSVPLKIDDKDCIIISEVDVYLIRNRDPK